MIDFEHIFAFCHKLAESLSAYLPNYKKNILVKVCDFFIRPDTTNKIIACFSIGGSERDLVKQSNHRYLEI